MAQKDYYITKPVCVIGNNTAGDIPAVAGATLSLFYKDGRVDSNIKILPGTYLAFRNLDHINADTVDYGNLSVADYVDTEIAFFLK